MEIKKSDTVGLIVSRNVNAASVFNYYGINYFSQGHRTLEHACVYENVSLDGILDELWELGDTGEKTPDFNSMPMVELASYILRTHHKYAEKKIVFIKNTLDRLIGYHGEKHSGLPLVKKAFNDLSVYLTVHMKHEEFIIFPFIHKLCKSRTISFPFQSIEAPISSMMDDHNHEAIALTELAGLTGNYIVPPDSDYTFTVTYNAMKELENDLKLHMHLENNILFPRAIELAASRTRTLN